MHKPTDPATVSPSSSPPGHAVHPGHDAHGDEVPRQLLAEALARRTPLWKPVLTFVILAAGVGAIVGFGAMPKLEQRDELVRSNEKLAALSRRVQIGAIRVTPPTRTISLPASLQPNAQADLFAQAVGYVRERHADIGDRVKTGDVLAVIDIPLVEEDLNRARAAFAEAEAGRAEVERTRALAKSSLDRWMNVQPAGAVSQQEIDERRTAYESAEAAFTAADAVIATRRAEVQRLERQQAFARVVAPFDGTITTRNIDVGDYIASAGPSSAPLFSIADTQTLRVYADVPQTFAISIQPGQTAKVSVRELPNHPIAGTVSRTSGSLNERTRTLRVEVTVPNGAGQVLAGAYGQVEFEVRQPTPSVIIPGSALIVRAEGPRVAVVDESSAIRYVPVVVGRDLGTEVEIAQGLTGQERVVVNLADELAEGTKVEVVPPPAPPAPTAK